MSKLLAIAAFTLVLSSLPATASAQSSSPWYCAFIRCASTGDGGSTAVPELDGNAAGAAGAVLVGAALLLSARRRRTA